MPFNRSEAPVFNDRSGLNGVHPRRVRESTVRHVFSLIWPAARIECCEGEDCYLVGVCEGPVRHVVRVPCALVEFDQGLALVRAVYKAGIPGELCCASSSKAFSL
jgi:hypothetical protein